jgi:UDP-glucose:(heptosyl)LPS alpha-1,3-glucosyltransferase
MLLRLEDLHFRERNYQKLIATTAVVKADLRQLYGVPDDDVAIIPNGFSPSEFNPLCRRQRRQAMREKLGLGADDIAMLFVANELPRKGYATVLAALRKLDQKRLRLLVVGRPPIAEVRAGAERAGVAGQVIACGPTNDVAGYHAAADLFVLPTQYEAFCLAILEALGSGLPVVCSDVPGARDAIVPGINGALLADPNDADELVETLKPLLDYACRARMAAAAPETVQQYQWPTVLVEYESILMQCAGVETELAV